MKPLSELTKEAEETFAATALHKDEAQQSYQHILFTLDNAMAQQDLAALMSLIPYIEEGNGTLAFQYIGKTHRLLQILHIIDLEIKFGKAPFSSNCSTAKELWDKYMTTVFALRRLIFCLSEDSVNEAVSYLQNQPISFLAAYIIARNELAVTHSDFFEMLTKIYENHWTSEDTQQFYVLINSQ